MPTRKAQDRRQLRLALGGYTYVAVDSSGSAVGERELPTGLPYITQREAEADPTRDELDSCVGRWHC